MDRAEEGKGQTNARLLRKGTRRNAATASR